MSLVDHIDFKAMSKEDLSALKTAVQDELNARNKAELEEAKARTTPYTADELIFSAGARCKACGAGLAYPKGAAAFVRSSWMCSAVLMDLPDGRTKPGQHEEFPFAFYKIDSEGSYGAAGTTRPT